MGLQKPLKVLYLTAECVPFAKTGGLADVAGALPKAIRALGHDVRIMMPRYGRVEIEKFELRRVLEAVAVPMDERTETAAIYEGSIGANSGLTPVYFVDSPRYFDRQGIYMYPDDAERFIFFSRAALETCRVMGWQPDIIHCNEWHTALIPNWLKTVYRDDPFFSSIATLYTAHNLEYQGIFGYRILEIAGLAETGCSASSTASTPSCTIPRPTRTSPCTSTLPTSRRARRTRLHCRRKPSSPSILRCLSSALSGA